MATTEQPTTIRMPKDLKAFLRRDAQRNKRLFTHHIAWILQFYRQSIERAKK